MHRFHILLILLVLSALTSADETLLEPDAVSKNYESQLPRSTPTKPADSLAKFSLVDGFEIELAANEPLVVDPVSMAFDEFGRLFVICMRGYSEHRDDKLGSVRLLEDTDNDGVFDQSIEYIGQLTWPTALACYDGGIFVGAAPDIWYFKDTDSDGKADVKEKLFTGFGHQNVQGMLNSFRWGLDNRLYGASGTNGGQVQSVGEGSSVPLRGKDFSFSPAARDLRPESGGAQHGATFDRWGNRYVCSNSDHLQWIEFDEYHRQRSPILQRTRSRSSIAVDGPSAEVFRSSAVEPWRIVRTRLRVKGLVGGPVEGGGRPAGYFTSASGVTAYTGDAYPEPYSREDYVFVGDVGSNLIHLKHVISQGTTKQATRATKDGVEFLTSTDNWFRPVQFANGPDGCIYVLDMYRETIEHPLSLPPMIKKHLDLNSGRDRGRIYRIRPTSWKPGPRPMPGDAGNGELVRMLSHPNGWHRETAARLVLERGRAGGRREAEFVRLLESECESVSPFGRIRAFYCLADWNRLTETRWLRQLQDAHPQVRIHALKVLERNPEGLGENVYDFLRTMVADDDLNVRLQLALTIGSLAMENRTELLVELAKSSADAKLRLAILSSVGEDHLAMLRTLLEADDSIAGITAMLDNLVSEIGRGKTKIPDAIGLAQSQETYRIPLLTKLLQGTNLRGAPLIQALEARQIENAQGVVAEVLEAAKTVSLEVQQSVQDRVQAIEVLSMGDFPQVQATLNELLLATQPAAVRDASVNALGQADNIEAAEILVEKLTTLPPVGRRRAFDLLTSRPEWAERLLQAITDETLEPSQVPIVSRQALQRHRDKSIASAAAEFFGGQRERAEIVREMMDLLSSRGDPEKGKLTFQKVCASCHRLDGIGSNVGPDLQPVRNRGAQFMLTNILDPNREVDARYEAYTAVTSDGKTHSGILLQDSARDVELLAADGNRVRIGKDELDELVATGRSLMPEGLEQDLKRQGIADVIAFLVQSVESQAKVNQP